MIRSTLFSVFVALVLGVPALAANLPASSCQIFIRRLEAVAGSHGSENLNVFVKVNWLGDGEFIQNVGFYATNHDRDLGNEPGSCSLSMRPSGTWYVQNPNGSSVYGTATEYGEYLFDFRIASGSVGGPCYGYSYSTSGAFFVQTNKNTYWLNPGMDSTRYFYFDSNGYESIGRKGGIFSNVFTDREDMKYYNPLSCQR